MAFDYYEFLGIDRHAAAEDVNRACRKKRRALTVENDAAGLQHLNQVQQTLLDAVARSSYDETQEFGDEIADLLAQASGQMEAEAWPDAARLLKRLLALAPQQVVARNLLGICFTRLEEYDAAGRLYARLLADYPDTPLFWANAGYVYHEQAAKYPLKQADGTLESECPHCEERSTPRWQGIAFQHRCDHCGRSYQVPVETRDVFCAGAREHYLKAIECEPYNPEHYFLVAETYTCEHRYPEAIAWAEKAIHADGKVDFDDFDHLFYLCRVYSLMGEPRKMEETAARIAAVVPSEIVEAREYAVYQFGNYACELSTHGLFAVAARFARCALVIDPRHDATRELFEFCDAVALASEEFDRLEQDAQLIEPMKRLAAYSLGNAHEQEIEDKEGVLDDILAHFGAFAQDRFLASLRWLKQRYPGAYRMNREFYDDCERDISLAPLPAQTAAPSCCAVLIGLLVSLLLLGTGVYSAVTMTAPGAGAAAMLSIVVGLMLNRCDIPHG